MKYLLALILAVGLFGCVSIPKDASSKNLLATLLASVPNGTTQSLDVTLTTPWGTTIVTGKGIYQELA